MASSLKEYLQRYVSSSTDGPGANDVKTKSKKKRKGKDAISAGSVGFAGKGVVIVDDDALWGKEEKVDVEDEPDEEGEGPTVIEDVEVKRMHRMEAMKTHRPYLSVANDGSGWVTVKDDDPEAAPGGRKRGYGSDNSGSRSPRVESLGVSATRNHSTDVSPPRRRGGSPDVAKGSKIASEDSSLPVASSINWKQKHRDLSPPRKRKDSPEQFTSRRRHDSPSVSPRRISNDLSPPRRKLATVSGNWNQRQDLSPPRRRRDSPDEAPVRKPVSEDLSPPRKSKNSVAVSNWKKSQDLSPPRKKPSRRMGDSTIASSPAQKRGDSPDMSPARQWKSSMAVPYRSKSQDLSPPRKKPARRMADGTIAGLTTDRDVVSEAERKRSDVTKFLSDSDPSLSGVGAETVFRDKRGRRLEGLEEMLRQQKGEAKPAEKPLEWGKGLAQKKAVDANIAELEAEKSKPFARYRDDAELDKSLKERLRWGDPMAHLVKQKIPEPVLEDLGEREEMKASGFIVPQGIPNHSWIKRGIAAPPNRYDIKPGRHWDGVDRSTGFEQGIFKRKNEKKARDQEAYLWSVSDM